jgi:hypothetical protein
MRFAVLTLLSRAAADYAFTTFYSQLSCAGTPVQTVANYVGCVLGQVSPPLSYDVTCVNSSAFDVSYFNGEDCSGPAIHSAVVGWDSSCTGSPDGKTTGTQKCTVGTYKPSKSAVNSYYFTLEKECPVTDLRYSGISSTPMGVCFAEGATGSHEFGCNKVNMTVSTVGSRHTNARGAPRTRFTPSSSRTAHCVEQVTTYFTSDCTGTASTPYPIAPLGCHVGGDAADPQVVWTTCGTAPPPAAGAQPRAVGGPAGPAVLGGPAAGLEAGLARAREMLAQSA